MSKMSQVRLTFRGPGKHRLRLDQCEMKVPKKEQRSKVLVTVFTTAEAIYVHSPAGYMLCDFLPDYIFEDSWVAQYEEPNDCDEYEWASGTEKVAKKEDTADSEPESPYSGDHEIYCQRGRSSRGRCECDDDGYAAQPDSDDEHDRDREERRMRVLMYGH